MPKLQQPNYPQGEYPYLSPNPNAQESIEDGGRETPVIVNTQPKFQQEGGIDPSILNAYAKKSDLDDYATKVELQGVETGIGVKYIGQFEGTDTIEDLYDEAGVDTPFAFNYLHHAAIGSFRWAVTNTAMILEVEYLDGSERFIAKGVTWSGFKTFTLSTFLSTGGAYYKPYTLESQLGVKNIGTIAGQVLGYLESQVDSDKPFAMIDATSSHPFIGSYHKSGTDYLLELEDLTTKDRFVYDSLTATDPWSTLTFANFLNTSGDYYKPYALVSDLPQGEINVDFNGTATGTTEALQRVVVGTKTYTVSSGMTNPMSAQGDLIVGASSGTPSRLGIGSAGKLLASTGSGLAYTDSLPILTTAPVADNSDGLKIVVLSSEPATKYAGYLYLITA